MKMLEKILFAGFGGQGILSIGKILADACVENHLEASWLPSYGPEMRGGTCNCLVVTSNEKILVVVNTSLVHLTEEQKSILKNVMIIEVDATDIAIRLGSVKCANMVMLGAYAKHSSALDLERLKLSVVRKFDTKPKVVEMNQQALNEGYKIA